MVWHAVVYHKLLKARRAAIRVAKSGQDALPHPVRTHASRLEAWGEPIMRPSLQRTYYMPADALQPHWIAMTSAWVAAPYKPEVPNVSLRQNCNTPID